MSERLKVLYFASNPLDTSRLQLDEEVREITRQTRQVSPNGDAFKLQVHWATRPGDLLPELNREQPQAVHFSGHGDGNGEIVLTDDAGAYVTKSPQLVADVFGSFRNVLRLVVLNACFSYKQAELIAEQIDFVIGMKEPIQDKSAICFAAHFYAALAAGASVGEAFSQGKIGLRMQELPGVGNVSLLAKVGADPNSIRLCNPATSSARPTYVVNSMTADQVNMIEKVDTLNISFSTKREKNN
jgi:CHAT domain